MKRKFLVGLVAVSLFQPSLGLAGDWSKIFSQGWKAPQSCCIPIAPDGCEIRGYSEFTPAYFQGVRPYETFLASPEEILRSDAIREFVGENGTYQIGIYEEKRHLEPGLQYLAQHWLTDLKDLINGETPGGDRLRGIPSEMVTGNEFWPAGIPRHKDRPIVSLTPLVLSRHQEDLGRTHPWMVHGGSEQDWEEMFWRSMQEVSPNEWWCDLLGKVYGNIPKNCDLKATGLRVLSSKTLPKELETLKLTAASAETTRFLVTFQPYSLWPASLKKAFAEKRLDVIPHPSTLIFSRVPLFETLAQKSRDEEARQIPLLVEFSQFAQHLNGQGLYALHVLDVSRRRHRFSKSRENDIVVRSALGVELDARESAKNSIGPFSEIFVPSPEVVGLYSKPIARNVQLWGVSGALWGEWLLDGPFSNADAIQAAMKRISDNPRSRVHFRNYFPPMQINGFSARWYRPLVAWLRPGAPVQIDTQLLGQIQIKGKEFSEWFPVKNVDRGFENATVAVVDRSPLKHDTTSLNAQKIAELHRLTGKKLTPEAAWAVVNPRPAKAKDLKSWLGQLPEKLALEISERIDFTEATQKVRPLTFGETASDRYEQEYWKKLVALSEGTFLKSGAPELLNKNNVDCGVATKAGDRSREDEHCAPNQNHLPRIVEYLRGYYEGLGLAVYSQKFDWKGDFNFDWWGGFKKPQENIIVVIHGKDNRPHDEAVILGDHYDTAYMEDIYAGKNYAEKSVVAEIMGHRHASKGSDDNHSATATLMEAARILKDLPLKKDIWLVHLTGEEFPADGLGTRALCQALVEDKALTGGKNPKIVGVYVMDMVGHDTDKDRAKPGENHTPIFQIAPGRGERAAHLALTAHAVTETWNSRVADWNQTLGRTKPAHRFKTPKGVPAEKWPLPELGKLIGFQGELRPGWHFRSSLFNTDPQLFSDYGFPTVLFMENYDIDRQGYHDTLDNLENIDRDYVVGVTAIAIETVAQVASH